MDSFANPGLVEVCAYFLYPFLVGKFLLKKLVFIGLRLGRSLELEWDFASFFVSNFCVKRPVPR